MLFCKQLRIYSHIERLQISVTSLARTLALSFTNLPRNLSMLTAFDVSILSLLLDVQRIWNTTYFSLKNTFLFGTKRLLLQIYWWKSFVSRKKIFGLVLWQNTENLVSSSFRVVLYILKWSTRGLNNKMAPKLNIALLNTICSFSMFSSFKETQINHFW